MVWNKLKATSVVLLRVDLLQLRVIDDAVLQAMSHIKNMLIRFFGVMELCLVDSLPHF